MMDPSTDFGNLMQVRGERLASAGCCAFVPADAQKARA
jgi:hypothetical protein